MPVGNCSECKQEITANIDFYKTEELLLCFNCFDQFYAVTNCCSRVLHFEEMFYSLEHQQYFCEKCHSVHKCRNCNNIYIDGPDKMIDGGASCVACHFYVETCQSCNRGLLPETVTNVVAAVVTEEGTLVNSQFKMCVDCFCNTIQCACGLLKMQDLATELPGSPGTYVCEGCVQFSDDGAPVFVSMYTEG